MCFADVGGALLDILLRSIPHILAEKLFAIPGIRTRGHSDAP